MRTRDTRLRGQQKDSLCEECARREPCTFRASVRQPVRQCLRFTASGGPAWWIGGGARGWRQGGRAARAICPRSACACLTCGHGADCRFPREGERLWFCGDYVEEG